MNTETQRPASLAAAHGSAIERAHWLQSEIRRAQRERSEHVSAAAALGERIEFLEAWEKELKPALCPECNGHGKLREWLAQDESRLVTCERCKGSGASPNAELTESAPENLKR
jgi:hypothetical protein